MDTDERPSVGAESNLRTRIGSRNPRKLQMPFRGRGMGKEGRVTPDFGGSPTPAES